VVGRRSKVEEALMSAPHDPALPRVRGVLEHRYWLRLLVGLLAIGVGAAAFAWPSATVQVIGILFGLNLLVTGLVRASLLLFVPGYPPLYRVLGIVFGVLTAIVGIVCLLNVRGSVMLLLVVVAVGWLLDGVVEIFLAVGNPEESGGGWRIGTGLALLVGALAVLVWPELGLATFVAIGATVLVFVGTCQVISAVGNMRASRRAAV
jgi:uncharacterized membrane protein HdeD (DUF308 family)